MHAIGVAGDVCSQPRDYGCLSLLDAYQFALVPWHVVGSSCRQHVSAVVMPSPLRTDIEHMLKVYNNCALVWQYFDVRWPTGGSGHGGSSWCGAMCIAICAENPCRRVQVLVASFCAMVLNSAAGLCGKARQAAALSQKCRDDAPWLTKLPVLNKNDHGFDAGLRLKATFECYALLWKNPSLSMACQLWLNDRLETPEQPDTDTTFSPEPTTIGSIPIEWLCGYLIDMGVGWSESLLGRAKAYDRSQIIHLVCGYLNVSPQMKLGRWASDKLVMKHAFDARRQQINARFEQVNSAKAAAASIDDVGQIKWGDIGIFKIELNEKKLACSVIHVPTKETAPITSDNIDSRWYMDKNYSDSKAAIQMDGSRTDKHYLHMYFGRGAGPNKEPMLVGSSSVWAQLMEAANQQVQENKRIARSGTIEKVSDNLDKDSKAIAQESAKPARKRMQEKRVERSKRSRLQIS